VVIDVDATLVTAHSEKENAAPTFKKGFGFHPLLTFADHGLGGTGEPLSVMLRKGNAGSNTAADHIAVLKAAFAQLPGHQPGRRPGRSVLVRADGAGGTHEFLSWLTGQRVQYSVGFPLPDTFTNQLAMLDKAELWQPAYDGDAPDPVRGVCRRSHRPAEPRVVARGDARHPRQRTTPPRRATTDHRPRRQLRSPRSRPTPPAANSLTSNCATAGARGVRTGSGSPKTPACGTCRCTTSTRTGSGSRSSPWPSSSPPGFRCSPSPTNRHAGGNPNDSDSGCSRSLPGSLTTAEPDACISQPTPRGQRCLPPASTASGWSQNQAEPTPNRLDNQNTPACGTGEPSDSAKLSCPHGTIRNHRGFRLNNDDQQALRESFGLRRWARPSRSP